jgi:hypothetical protein
MTIDTARLRALAEASERDRSAACQWYSDARIREQGDEMAYQSLMDLRDAVDGATILALLDERDAMERERDEAREAAKVEARWLNAVRAQRDDYMRMYASASAELGRVSGALGGDAYWMDPPDGGNVTLAEQVERANEAGRERDALAAMLRECRVCLAALLCDGSAWAGGVNVRELAAKIDALGGARGADHG